MGWAQSFSDFSSGSYVLTSEPNVSHPGTIRFYSAAMIGVKDSQGKGKNLKFRPEEVNSFRIGPQQYVTMRTVRMGTKIRREEAFVALVDSGQVMLYNLTRLTGGSTHMGAGGGMTYSAGSEATTWVLRYPQDVDFVPIIRRAIAYQSFKEQVRPFLVSRPDLLAQLENKNITYDNLPEAIHALNTGQHLVFPTSHYEIMKQQALDKRAAKKVAADSTKQ